MTLAPAKMAVKTRTTQVEKLGKPPTHQVGDAVVEVKAVEAATSSELVLTARKISHSQEAGRRSTPPQTVKSFSLKITLCRKKWSLPSPAL